MTRRYHGTSHLGRCNIDGLVDSTPILLRRHLEIYLQAAENKMRNGLQQPTGDMWTRGYVLAKELREQIAILDAIDYGAIVPLEVQS